MIASMSVRFFMISFTNDSNYGRFQGIKKMVEWMIKPENRKWLLYSNP